MSVGSSEKKARMIALVAPKHQTFMQEILKKKRKATSAAEAGGSGAGSNTLSSSSSLVDSALGT